MLFSIITPSFKQLDWLRLCVASVRDQVPMQEKEFATRGSEGTQSESAASRNNELTHLVPESLTPNSSPLRIEHIIQDAGSPDIEEFAREFGAEFYRDGKLVFDSRGRSPESEGQGGVSESGIPHPESFRYRIAVYCESDGGMYDAINRGLSRAKGEICAWLNCDEQYLPYALDNVAGYFNKALEFHMVFGDAILLNQEGIPYSYRRVVLPSLDYLRTVSPNLFSCSLFFRRNIVDAGILFDPQWKILGDAAWFYAVFSGGYRAHILRKPLAAFAMTGQNLSGLQENSEKEWENWRRQQSGLPFLPKSVLVGHHRLKKLLAGAYLPRLLDVAVYRLGQKLQRTSLRANVGFKWDISRSHGHGSPASTRPAQILIVAQTPPPMHGQSFMNALLLGGTYQKIRCQHVRMAFSEDIKEVGGFRWKKIVRLFVLAIQIIWKRIRTGADVLYYPPASPNLVPFLRDCVILILTRWMFRKTVFHFHANGISDLFNTLPGSLKLLYRLAYSRPDLCICLTQCSTNDARHFDARRIEIVPNGIPDMATESEPRPETLAKAPPKILFLATVSLEKGAGVVLDAAKILLAKGVKFRCEMAGPFATDRDEQTLTALAARNHLDGIVTWRGLLSGDAKWEAYRSADIFCFPTNYRTEGLPVVLLEAMMFGLPSVSTNWRGIPDVIVDGLTGFLVEPNDAAGVADKLEKLIDDRELRGRMGAAARKRYMENFTVDQFRANMEKVLASV